MLYWGIKTNDSVIVFSVIKIKMEAANKLPKGFVGWAGYEECDIFAKCIEKIIMKKSVFSSNYLDKDDFTINDDGKIVCTKGFEKTNADYVCYFGIDILNKIFYDEEFTNDFLSKILPLYIIEQQKKINEHQQILEEAQLTLEKLNSKSSHNSRVKKFSGN